MGNFISQHQFLFKYGLRILVHTPWQSRLLIKALVYLKMEVILSCT